MEAGGWQWVFITVICVALLAIVLLWAMGRNRAQRGTREQSEAATARLYKDEDAARDPMDDGTV